MKTILQSLFFLTPFLCHANEAIIAPRIENSELLKEKNFLNIELFIKSAIKKSPTALNAAMDFLEVLKYAKEKPIKEKLEFINDYVNNYLEYSNDIQTWGKYNYWGSPLEILEKKKGNCKHFAILKYFALRSLGIPSQKLHLYYVLTKNYNPPNHLVLAYGLPSSDDLLILDSLSSHKIIEPISSRTDLIVDLNQVRFFNEDVVLLKNNDEKNLISVSPIRLEKWRDVIPKSQSEGFLNKNN